MVCYRDRDDIKPGWYMLWQELIVPAVRYYVLSYIAFIVAAVVLCVVIALTTELLGLTAARGLYVSMLRNVVLAPMR